MGITYTTDDHSWDGDTGKRTRLTAAFDASYTAGGETLAASDAELGTIDEVHILDGATESGYVPSYDDSAGKLLLFEEGGTGGPLTEVPGGTDASSETVTVVVRGRS